uniref:C-type lectin domain-containing protein n=1 Tax=Acanthochromis polyacanthus TaxID=80966 RepID=A0A3Q1HMR9_9TELE
MTASPLERQPEQGRGVVEVSGEGSGSAIHHEFSGSFHLSGSGAPHERPTGWLEFMGNCYLHFAERVTWSEAEQHCQELNAHLVSISSQEEQQFVNGEWLTDRSVCWWESDGGSCPSIIYGDRSFVNWRPNQPDNYFNSGEDCVVMIWQEGGQWNDVPCNYHLPFTCKTGPGQFKGLDAEHTVGLLKSFCGWKKIMIRATIQ